MFITLDAGGAKLRGSSSPSASGRACDQCKARKVRCDMSKPCVTCVQRSFDCTYYKARKKRGPAGKRIAEIQRQQTFGGSAGAIGNISSVVDHVPTETEGRQALYTNGTAAQEWTRRSLSTDASSRASLGQAELEAPQSAFMGNHIPESSQELHGTQTTDDSFLSRTRRRSLRNEAGRWQPRNEDSEASGPGPSTSASREQPRVGSIESLLLPATQPHGAIREPNFEAHMDYDLTSPETNDFIFPSLPVESPSSTIVEAFRSIPQNELLPSLEQSPDIWPTTVNEKTLLPWIDVYFKRLHPTIPILNRATLYHDMLLQKHHIDKQYGAMLLGLCAFAMEQPVQIHERAMKASRSVQSRMLLQECAKMRVLANFGEEPTLEMALTSFFMFACLFGAGEHKAARHRLREAVDLAISIGLHLPQSYIGLALEVREQWLRTYLVLSVTERAYALQQSHSISIRGRPGITARFMQAFDDSLTNEYISSLLYRDQDQFHIDAVSMTGLLYLMDTFDAIDESLMDCWNGYCRISDGICDSFDRRRALQMFRAQYRVREACLGGNISFAPTVTPIPLGQLLESQRADIEVTQLWLLNRLWQLCFSHGLLRESSEHPGLRYGYAFHVAQALVTTCNNLSLSAMEVHGLGFVMKVYDIATGVVAALQSSATVQLDTPLAIDPEDTFTGCGTANLDTSVRELMRNFARLMDRFRGGDHKYKALLERTGAGIVEL